MAGSVHPEGFFLQSVGTKPARSRPAIFLRYDQPDRFENLHMLLDSGEGHIKGMRQIGDRCLALSETFEDAAPCGVGKGEKGSIQSGIMIVNHMDHYYHCRTRQASAAILSIEKVIIWAGPQRSKSRRKYGPAAYSGRQTREKKGRSGFHFNPVFDLLTILENGAGNLPASVLGADDDLIVAGL